MHKPRSAEDILRSLSLTKPEDIDLEAIAWLQGAKVKYRDLDGCEACIVGRADVGRAIISIDTKANERRQRFSLAHELGHWEWHRGQKLFCAREEIAGSGTRRVGMNPEATANRFAAEALMPSFMLKPLLRDFRRFDMRAVAELASAFGTSKTAMAFRLVELDFEPSLLVAHGRDGRRWFIRAKSIDERWFPKNRLDDQSGAFDILHKGQTDDRFMSAVEGDTWFDAPGSDQFELGEQSFRTSDDEVVTLLVARSQRMLAD